MIFAQIANQIGYLFFIYSVALSNGPLPPSVSLTPSRNNHDNGSSSYDYDPPSSIHNNNTGRTTPNPSLLTQRTPPPPSLQPSLPPMPSSSYMPMSPRNQYTVTSDTPFLQTNNQVFVFTTQLANDAAESVLKNEHPNIIEYHKSLPSTTSYLTVCEILIFPGTERVIPA